MIDVRIDHNDGNFKFRVCGILEHNNKFLVVRMNDNKFYCLPGGHVELDEDTDHAVEREMEEELGFPVKKKRLLAIHQNFFKGKDGKPFHELGYYYIVEPVNPADLNTNDYVRMENDKGYINKLEFKWLTLDEMKSGIFLPKIVPQIIDNKSVENIITRDK